MRPFLRFWCFCGWLFLSFGSHIHSQQSPQVLATAGSVVQFLLTGSSLHRHTFTLSNRQRAFLDTIKEQFGLFVSQRCRHRPNQPVLQNADTANAALIKIRPLVQKWFDIYFKRNLL